MLLQYAFPDDLRIADNSEVDPPLRTEGVVIMLWPITYRSSATDVRDNDASPKLEPGPETRRFLVE